MYIQGLNPTTTYTDAAFALGQRGVDVNGNEYVFLRADGAVSKGAACFIKNKGTEADEVTTANGAAKVICIAPVAVADNAYAWFCIHGNVEVETAVVAQGAGLYTTGTAGRLDDSSASSALKLSGCVAQEAQATAGNLTECYLSYPVAA